MSAPYMGQRLFLSMALFMMPPRSSKSGRTEQGWVNVGTLKEPGRVEGKKTMGLELAEQLGWTFPDVIIYPTGGGSGIIGMWKAFLELKAWLHRLRHAKIRLCTRGRLPAHCGWHRKRCGSTLKVMPHQPAG